MKTYSRRSAVSRPTTTRGVRLYTPNLPRQAREHRAVDVASYGQRLDDLFNRRIFEVTGVSEDPRKRRQLFGPAAKRLERFERLLRGLLTMKRRVPRQWRHRGEVDLRTPAGRRRPSEANPA